MLKLNELKRKKRQPFPSHAASLFGFSPAAIFCSLVFICLAALSVRLQKTVKVASYADVVESPSELFAGGTGMITVARSTPVLPFFC